MPHQKEKNTKMDKYSRLFVLIFFVAVIVFVPIWVWVNKMDFSGDKDIEFGVTFSHKYTDEVLGLDWTEVYWQVISDLGVKKIRLVAPWDWIEMGNGEYNFNDLDWMISEADKKDIDIILAIGRRTPRWPECHDPAWLAELSKKEQGEELLEMIGKLVKRFMRYENISAWQVENEPFLSTFGECSKPDEDLIRREVELVRSLDDRPILTTHSGELGSWNKAASLADIFGTTMYKAVWTPVIGDWRYPIPPAFYYYKSKKIQEKYGLDKVIVAELQAEPWAHGGGDADITDIRLNDQFNSFNLDDFWNNLEYVEQAGFSEAYLWGVEWWYWLKEEQGHPEFWEEAKRIWQD